MIIASDVENTIRNGWRRGYGAFGARSRLCVALLKFKRHNRSFRLLCQALAKRRIMHLAHEPDPARRTAIYEFPREMRKLRNNLLLFYTGDARSASSILSHQVEQTKASDHEMVANLDRTKELGRQSAKLLVDILRACGDDLTRANVLKQATSIKATQMPMFLPGVIVSSAPGDYRLIKSLQPVQFDGTRWNKLGSFVAID